jgi:hypothetical protein
MESLVAQLDAVNPANFPSILEQLQTFMREGSENNSISLLLRVRSAVANHSLHNEYLTVAKL